MLIGLARQIFIGVTVTALLTTSVSANPLKTAPLPLCGAVDDAFLEFLAKLNQSPVWRGRPGGKEGELRLYVGRDGAWTLFYHAHTSGRERVCAISRGTDSRVMFGSPV